MARASRERSSRPRSRPNAAAHATLDTRRAPGWRAAAWAVTLVAATVVAYLPVFRHDFVAFDDLDAIVTRAEYNPPTLSNLWSFWTRAEGDLYTPVLWTVWGLLAFAGRSETAAGVVWDATPFHAFNLFAHAGAAVFAFLVLRRIVRSDRASFAGAALFALHPMQVEAVAWVSGMKTPLSGLFALWAAWHYLCFSGPRYGGEDATPDAGASGRRACVHYALGTFAFALALVTKPTVIVMPVIIGMVEWMLRGRRDARTYLPLAGWLVLALAFGLLNQQAQGAITIFRPEWWQRPLIALDSLSFYLRKLVWPWPLLPDYSRTPEAVVAAPWLWAAGVPALVLIVSAAVAWRRAPWFTVAVATFVLGVVTTIGLISFDYQNYSTVADRYAYLSIFGPALAVAYLLREPEGSRAGKRWPLALGAVVIAACAVLTFVQCRIWHDTRALFDHTLRYNPRSLAAYRSLTFDAYRAGRAKEALAYARRGLESRPGDALLWQFVGNISMERGRTDDAIAAFREATKTGVSPAPSYNSLGVALAASGRAEEAGAAFAKAVEIDPQFAPAHENLGIFYAQHGRWTDALLHLTQAARADPASDRRRALVSQVAAMRDAAAAKAPLTQPTSRPVH